jgi:hypothetical protein
MLYYSKLSGKIVNYLCTSDSRTDHISMVPLDPNILGGGWGGVRMSTCFRVVAAIRQTKREKTRRHFPAITQESAETNCGCPNLCSPRAKGEKEAKGDSLSLCSLRLHTSAPSLFFSLYMAHTTSEIQDTLFTEVRIYSTHNYNQEHIHLPSNIFHSYAFQNKTKNFVMCISIRFRAMALLVPLI